MHLSIPIIIMHIIYFAIACNMYFNGGSESNLMLSLNKYFSCHSVDVIKCIIFTLVVDLLLLSSMDMFLRLGIKKVRFKWFQNIQIIIDEVILQMQVLYLIPGFNAYWWSFFVLAFSSIYLTNDFNYSLWALNQLVFGKNLEWRNYVQKINIFLYS